MAAPQRIVINIRDQSGDSASAAARQTVVRWFVALTVLMVLFCGLFPFDFLLSFSGAINEIRSRFDLSTGELFTTNESWEKLIFYLPLGFALGSLLWVWRGQPVQRILLRCAIALVCGTAIATAVEILQVFLSRDPSLADILAKVTGTAIGFGVFIAIGEPMLRWVARGLVLLQKIKRPGVFAVIAGVWLLSAVVAPILARNIGNLNSWEPAYPLLIGNETDGVRHWDGTISNVWLSAAAVGDDELETLLASQDPGQASRGSLMMAFHLDGAGPYADATGHTSSLEWTPNFNTGAVKGTTQPADLLGLPAIGRVGVPISEGWWLSTKSGGAAQAVDRISHTHAFTLVLDLACQNLDHGDGWPRIFSISKNADECNLQLLQDRENLQLRIRSDASGDSGTDPEFYVPGIFIDTTPQRLIVSYDHGRIRVESSHSGERFALQYLPDAWLVWRTFPSSYWHYTMNTSGHGVARGMYRILAMLPVGLLLGAILRILRSGGRSRSVPRIFIAGVCGSVIVLEASLVFAAGTPFYWVLPLVSLLAACAGVWLILKNLPIRKRFV